MSSIKDVFQENYPKLMRALALPMNDEYFMAELYARKLLPGNLKDTIKALSTGAEKASKFLDDVIKRSLESNDCTKFHTLLRLLMENDDDTIKKLAERIRNLLNETTKRILNQTSSNDELSKHLVNR